MIGTIVLIIYLAGIPICARSIANEFYYDEDETDSIWGAALGGLGLAFFWPVILAAVGILEAGDRINVKVQKEKIARLLFGPPTGKKRTK